MTLTKAALKAAHRTHEFALRCADRELRKALAQGLDDVTVASRRDLFERESYVVHVLDEIVYGSARNLADVLRVPA